MVETPVSSQFNVVVSDEEQYSVWLADRALAPGWRTIGVIGTREECLRYIEEHWIDMRPLSLRRAMSNIGIK